MIIDTSTPGKGKHILAELAAADIKASEITDIVITHHDADHVGGAAYLQQATGAKLWMHEKDIAGNMGRDKRPFLKDIIGLFMKPELPNVTGIITKNGEIIPGILAIETPGHTPGHTVYQYEDVLFSGDAVRVKKDGSLSLMPAAITADKATALKSLATIQHLSYKIICPAHQVPVHIP